MAAVAFAMTPASAAKIHAGCSGANLEKTENAVEAMPDANVNKMPAFKEIVDAQTAMLSGKMGACAMHLNKAMRASMAQ